MYKKILAAVNEHLNSEIAARYAVRMAKACDAKLYLCFVAGEGISRQGVSRAEEAMTRLFLMAREMEIPVEQITETGDPVREIERVVQKEKIDLVFASTRREDVERRFYARTVARGLSLRLPCSVAIVRVVHMGRIPPGKILVPLKARIPRIRERAYFTARMADGFGSRIYIFHVTDPVTRFFHGEIHLTPVEWEERLPADIADFMKNLQRYGIEFEKRLSPGTAAQKITIEARTQKQDLVIMGASQRSLWKSMVRGSPVEQVLRETPCDLIILTPRHED